jgi:hypothetical protein
MIDLIDTFIAPLEKSGLRYVVTGSVAAMAYGEPRLTNDIDLVLEISRSDADRLIGAFPEDCFYLPPRDVIETECLRANRGHINIISFESMLKADVYLSGKDPLHVWALENLVKIPIGMIPVSFAPVAYVIIRKMEFFQEGSSEKHLRDIANLLEHDSDIAQSSFLSQQIEARNLTAIWQKIIRLK